MAGVRAPTPEGPLEVRADLVVGADGRALDGPRRRAGLRGRGPRRAHRCPVVPPLARAERSRPYLGRFDAGRIFVMLDRGDYWQCGFVIPKGALDELRAAGLPAFRTRDRSWRRSSPTASRRSASWDDVKLLTVQVDRLRTLAPARAALHRRRGPRHVADRRRRYQPGDPGRRRRRQPPGRPLRDGSVTDDALAAVERRRMFPTRVTQFCRSTAQKRIISRVLGEPRQDQLRRGS